MTLSPFTDKSHPPGADELRAVLGSAHKAWTRFVALVGERIDSIEEQWGFTSAKTGWGLRLRRKGRVLVYVTPQRGSFLVSFALGEKAVAAARERKLPAAVLKRIDAAPRYAEGRGVRFDVRQVRDVAALVVLAELKHES